MKYITIDGDDIGQKIASSYLKNDENELIRTNDLVQEKTAKIADYLKSQGFSLLFCAADGVAGSCSYAFKNDEIFEEVKRIAGAELSFSAGVGETLRDSYIALLSAKSSGKSRLHDFNVMI